MTNELNEAGFYNPFDDENSDLYKKYKESLETEKKFYVPLKSRSDKKSFVKNVRCYDNKLKENSIQLKDGHVFAKSTFYPNDIVEIAPVKLLTDKDLYSSNVRDMVFMIDPSKRLFGIPMGKAAYYRTSIDTNLSPNIDYYYEPEKDNSIVLYATKKVKKGDELIIDAHREKMHNEYVKEDMGGDYASMAAINGVNGAAEPKISDNNDSTKTGVPCYSGSC